MRRKVPDPGALHFISLNLKENNMFTSLSSMTNWPITMVQDAKKTWTKTYVQNENIRTALDAFVDAQTVFVKQIVANMDTVAKEVSEELGKFPKFELSTAKTKK
jgi:hypothetical protein